MQKTFIEILRSSVDERRTLFETVAAHLDTQAANIEKDLYVCWVLDFLFNRRPNDPVGLYFKGGTSLSKAYGLVRRFSEDIDIGMDRLMEMSNARLRETHRRLAHHDPCYHRRQQAMGTTRSHTGTLGYRRPLIRLRTSILHHVRKP